jgi:uncharacterized protein (DUF58 family)
VNGSDSRVYVTLGQLTALSHRARGFSFLPRQPVTSLLAGGHASKLRGRGLDFQEIRKYLPGDDPRTIDWKVTARTRSPHTRVFTEERERPVLLLVDQRIGMFLGSVLMMKSVAAAEAAALAAWRTIAVKDRVGAIVFNDTEVREIRPQRTRSSVIRILGTIVTQNRALRAESPARPNPGRLNDVLERAARLATHDFLVVLISDGTGTTPETRRWLTTISRHNDVLIVLVSDPLETAIPPSGTLVVSDGERQMEIDTGDTALTSGFRRDFEDRFATAKRFLLTRDVPVLSLRTDADVAQQISRALGARPGAGHG